jgi:hypothetical protein
MKNRNRSCGGLTENENSNNSNNGVLMDEKWKKETMKNNQRTTKY